MERTTTMFGRHEIDPTAAHERAGALTLLDVRDHHEWQEGHVSGATHLPLASLPARFGEIDASRPVAVICRSGNRSAAATRFLRRHGLDVVNVSGGMVAWERHGLPIATETGRPGRVA
jgi:rhodanese-related sulfurtransferase